MHPSCELRRSGELGYGVFATDTILRGTLVYVKDQLEIEITPEQFPALPAALRERIETYSYIDPQGTRIVSWDIAKYVNHRCDCNTMSTGWGFEIALRDIEPGEEITDEYGLFNLESPMNLACRCAQCRKVLQPDDAERLHPVWDKQVRGALEHTKAVPQPLWNLLAPGVRLDLEGYLRGKRPYRSVSGLRRVSVGAD